MSDVQHVGPYLLESKLGEGGMGAVFRARHATQGHVVALKLLRRELLSEEGSLERFRREAHAMARISNPYVVRIYEHGQDERVAWIALELIEGESLDRRLRRDGPLAPRDAIALLTALCRGVEAAHAVGVLHRDLKPANVLIRASDGQPLLTDFGLARASGASQQLTRTGEILGTPSYMPPEQAGSAYDVTPAADVYGLGAILYAALTAAAPFQAGTVLQVLDRVLNAPPERPSRLRGEELPAELEELCLRCLAKDPSARPATPLALRRALSGLSLEAAPSKPSPRVLLALALSAVFLAGAAGSLALAPSAGAASPSPPPSASAPQPPITPSEPQRSPLSEPSPSPQALEPIAPPLWPAAIFGRAPSWALALESLAPELLLVRLEELSHTDDLDLRFQVLVLASEAFVRPCVVTQNRPRPSEELLRRGHALFEVLTKQARMAEQRRDQARLRLVRLFRGRLSYALGQLKLTDPSLAQGAALRDLDRAWGDLAAFNQDPPPGRLGHETVAYAHLALLKLGARAAPIQRAQGLEYARALQESRPTWALGYVAEARALAARGKPAQAQEVALRGIARAGERPLLLLWLHWRDQEAGEGVDFERLERAIRGTERPGERLIGYLELCSSLANERPDEVSGALARLDRFLAGLRGGRAWAAVEVGGLRAQVLPAKEALLAATEALALEPPSALKRAQLLGLRARAHQTLGQTSDAKRDVQAAMALQLAPAVLLLELEWGLAAGDQERVELALYRLWSSRATPAHRRRARRLMQDALGEGARPLLTALMSPVGHEDTPGLLRALPSDSPLRLLLSLTAVEHALGQPTAAREGLVTQGLALAERALATGGPELALEARLIRARLCALALPRRGTEGDRLREQGLADVEDILPRLDATRRAALRFTQHDLAWGTFATALSQSELQRAERVLRSWHEEAPFAPEPVGALGSCLAQQGRLTDAVELVSAYRALATPSWPQRGQLDVLLATLLRQAGRYSLALNVGRAATSLPNSSVSERLRAIVDLTKTLLLYGPNPPLWPLEVSGSGMRFLPGLKQSDPEATRLSFEVPFVHARALRSANKPKEALTMLRRCEQAAQARPDALALVESERAANLIALGQREAGLERLERAIELSGQSNHRLARAKLLQDLGRRPEARLELERVDPAQLPNEAARARYRRLSSELKAARPAD